MKTVTVTLKFEFETDDIDDENLTQLLQEAFEERAGNEELLDKAKVKIVENGSDDENDPEFEDDEA